MWRVKNGSIPLQKMWGCFSIGTLLTFSGLILYLVVRLGVALGYKEGDEKSPSHDSTISVHILMPCHIDNPPKRGGR